MSRVGSSSFDVIPPNGVAQAAQLGSYARYSQLILNLGS